MATYEVQLIGPGILIGTPWWHTIHQFILEAYKPTRENWPLPRGFQRLDLDVNKAGVSLCEELGPDSMVAVTFDGDDPIGCAAVQRFKEIRQSDVDGSTPADAQPSSSSSISPEVRDVPSADGHAPNKKWEINLVTTASGYRNKGVARHMVSKLEAYVVRENGNIEMMVRSVDEISGGYWRRLGFTTVEEYCITLPKGFSHVKDAPDELCMPGDVRLWTGKKDIGP